MEIDQSNFQEQNGTTNSSTTALLPFVEKYRPDDLSDIISHKEIVSTISKFIEEKKMPHLLFHGPPGTGKTSCIQAVAKHLFGNQNYKNMILELNASDDRGINVVREQIKGFCSTQQLMRKGIKLVILDECDSMTNTAQMALRRIVEKYTKTTRFCLICNYISKIIPALQSRCTRFRFGPLSTSSVLVRLNEISIKEGLQLESDAANAIVKLSGGDMRKVLNILESCSLAHKQITAKDVFDVTGRPSIADMNRIYDDLLMKKFNEALKDFMNLKVEKSLALEDVITELHKAVMKTKLSEDAKMFLIQRMAEIEYRLSQGSNEKVQIASLVGAFIEVRSFKS